MRSTRPAAFRLMFGLMLACCAPAAALRLSPPGLSPLSPSPLGRAPSTAMFADDEGSQPLTPPPPVAEPLLLTQQLELFRRLATPYFEQVSEARTNFGILIVLTLLNSGTSVAFSYVSRDFWSTLSAKDVEAFYGVAAQFAAALVVATPLTVLYKYQRRRLALFWREWMTQQLAAQYYSDSLFYRLEVDGEIDNPDQRIAEDVKYFTRVSLDFFITLATSVIDLVAFSGILYSIYPNLFFAIFAYAGTGSVATVFLGRALVGQNAEQLLREADLRHAPLRASAATPASIIGSRVGEVDL